MATFTVTISNPKYVYTGGASGKQATDVPLADFIKQHSFDSISTCVFHVKTDVISKYSLETDDTNNALQLNSSVTVMEGAAYHFRGYVLQKPVYKSFDDGNYLEVTCWGFDGVLANSLCIGPNDETVWTMESSAVAVTDLPLIASNDYGAFQGSTLWPDPADAVGVLCYVTGASDVIYTDGLGTDLADDATEIILTTTSKGFIPRGWIFIDTEWIYFDGYDNYNADTKYRLYNCVRGCLGTVAATHAEGSTAQEMLGKQIAARPCTVENDPLGGVAWVKLRRAKEYDAHAALGCFVLPQTAIGTYQGTYSVYDEDLSLGGANNYSLNDIVTALMTGSRDYGGPGFVAGDLDLDSTTAAVKVNRYDYDPESKPKNVYDAIQQLIAGLSLENEIKFWYKHSTGKFRLTVILNSASSFTLPNASESMEEVTMEDCYSAVRVNYTDDQTLNRACKLYSWHQAATGVTTSPDHYTSYESGGDSWGPGVSATNHDAAGTGGMEFTCDGAPGSKLGAIFEHDPGGSIEFGHYWFGAGVTPPTISLDRISLKINSYRAIDAAWQDYYNTDMEYSMRVEGCNDYNSTTHAGTWVDLGFGLEGKPNPEGTWVGGEAVAFSIRNVNAIRLVWDYMAGYKTAHSHIAFVHDIEIEGDTFKYEFIQLTGDPLVVGYPRFVYAPASYEKLRGGVDAHLGLDTYYHGPQRVKEVNIGASSQPAAVSIGRIHLITSLRRSKQRRYRYEGILPGTPELGITVTDVGAYVGVLREYSYAVGAGGIGYVTGVILDTSADVIE